MSAPIVFTDGSCFDPDDPRVSTAAWAVLVGKATTSEEQEAVVNLGLNTLNLVSSFVTAAVSRCHGPPTISRAEPRSNGVLQ